MDVAVIGSGVSGISVAHALIARGLKVTVLDVGETLEPRRQTVVAKLHDLPTEAWPADDFALIHRFIKRRRDEIPEKAFFGSDSIYASDRPFAALEVPVGARVPYPTFTKGGFSNVWGAAVLPIDGCDMADWPFSRSELDPYFRKVAALLPICGGAGTLEGAFPAYNEALGEVDCGPQGDLLLQDLNAAEPALSEMGLLFGKARLTIHTAAAAGGILPCNGCGFCFTGCVRGSIFATPPLLEEMIRKGQVLYKPGFYAESVAERDGRAEVEGIDPQTGARIRAAFDAIFLACGPLNTARVLLRSRSLYEQRVVLKESQKFAMPILRLGAAETAIEHPSVTLTSVFIEMKDRALSDHWLHVQVLPFYEVILASTPLPGSGTALGRRLWSPVLRRMMGAWCGMHSDHSSEVALTLHRHSDADRLQIELRESEHAHAMARRAAYALFRRGLKFRTLFLHGLIRFANPGSGTHCGASFPMRAAPSGPFDSDLLGRPFGWSRIFAVDASVLPSIPGTTLAFTVMANAYRIGSLAPV